MIVVGIVVFVVSLVVVFNKEEVVTKKTNKYMRAIIEKLRNWKKNDRICLYQNILFLKRERERVRDF